MCGFCGELKKDRQRRSSATSSDSFDQAGEIAGSALVIPDLLSGLGDEEKPRHPDQNITAHRKIVLGRTGGLTGSYGCEPRCAFGAYIDPKNI